MPALLKFLNEQGRKQQFFPVMDEGGLAGIFPGLDYTKFRILYDRDQNIAACGAVWDQREYKQYVVKGYGKPLKYLYPLSRNLGFFGIPALPRPGTMLDFGTLSFWAVRNHDPAIIKIFIKLITESLCGVPFMVLGICEKHPLMPSVQKISKLAYWSKGYLVDWKKPGGTAGLNPDLPFYLECGLL